METILIKEAEKKFKKSGDKGEYYKFFTSLGWMSCFEHNVYDKIMPLIPCNIAVDFTDDGKYKTIRAVGDVDAGDNTTLTPTEEPATIQQPQTNKPLIDFKARTMLTSYAKDIFVAFVAYKQAKGENIEAVTLMDSSTKLVKQAYDEFK